jgi:Xaa-Pro aminopeptidase
VGHGLGLEPHEIPVLAPLTTREFEPDMVIAVETRFLVPNSEGYHVEDILLVTEGGARVLTSQKGTGDLFVVD